MVSRVIARPLELIRDNIRRESPIEEYKLAMHNHGLLIILRWDVSHREINASCKIRIASSHILFLSLSPFFCSKYMGR